MGRRRVKETAKAGGLCHILRYDHFGDKGKQVGCNVSREVAEAYVAEHRETAPNSVFEVVKA